MPAPRARRAMSWSGAPGRFASGPGSRWCCRGRRSRRRRSPRAGSSVGRASCGGQCRTATDMLTRMPGSGPIALVGSGEFLPAMDEIDAVLLAATARRRPRVAILPTASWPDGEEVFRRWAAMGVDHFTALGAEVEPVLVRDRFDAEDDAHVQAIGEADLIYLSGGKPGHLSATLVGSPVGDALLAAHLRGAAIAGCSAG